MIFLFFLTSKNDLLVPDFQNLSEYPQPSFRPVLQILHIISSLLPKFRSSFAFLVYPHGNSQPGSPRFPYCPQSAPRRYSRPGIKIPNDPVLSAVQLLHLIQRIFNAGIFHTVCRDDEQRLSRSVFRFHLLMHPRDMQY